MSELRTKMDSDMVLRGVAVRTREAYLDAVRGLARFYRRRPDQISEAEVQSYLMHLLKQRGLSGSTFNIVANGAHGSGLTGQA
jgi:integrase/recombinase XerD